MVWVDVKCGCYIFYCADSETAVTAYLESDQLPLFAFLKQHMYDYVERFSTPSAISLYRSLPIYMNNT